MWSCSWELCLINFLFPIFCCCVFYALIKWNEKITRTSPAIKLDIVSSIIIISYYGISSKLNLGD